MYVNKKKYFRIELMRDIVTYYVIPKDKVGKVLFHYRVVLGLQILIVIVKLICKCYEFIIGFKHFLNVTQDFEWHAYF